MPNLKLYLSDLSDSRVRSIYLSKDIAVLELTHRERSINTQIQINMNVEISARPYMAGELEKEPFLRKVFYLGKIFGREHSFDLTDENTLTMKSKNELGHDFILELLANNELGQTSWWITQGHFDKERDVFFKCDHQGIISAPQESLPESLWFIENFAREENPNDENAVRRLKGKRLSAAHFGYPTRLFFSDQNNPEDTLQIWFNNGAKFSGQTALKMDVLTDQYRNCETEIEFSRYAQFIDRVVENVLIDKDNSLILDFENSATLTVKGDPTEDDYTDILWSLIETKNWQPLFDCYSSHIELADVPIPKTKFSQRDLLKHIDKYMKLQTAVLKKFAEKEPYILRQDTFLQTRKRGTLYLDGSRWDYFRHGAGFSFTEFESEVELNIHTHAHEPEKLDEWRIICYLNSLFPNEKIDGETIKSTMQSLAEKSGNPLHLQGQMYTWDVKKTRSIFPSFLNFLRNR